MASGAYVICIFVMNKFSIQIGKLGVISFEKGYYYYVGSAFNRNQKHPLEMRVLRHLKLSDQKKIHWHIDYFLSNQKVRIFSVLLIPSFNKEECEISQIIENLTDASVLGFGCSDCSCKSHLYYSKKYIFQKMD